MKRILRIGEGYALTKHKRKQYTIRYISLLALLTSMCLYAVKQVSAQQAEPAATAVADVKPLQIGDTIPDWLWNLPLPVVNHSQKALKLRDYMGKSMIIDFWSTWCGSCLAGFPVMASLQAEFQDELAVLLVNTSPAEDTPDRINKIFGQMHARTGYRLKLPYVLGDTVLTKVFPHYTIPHYVWINKEGIVTVMTHARDVTKENVSIFLRSGSVDVHVKHDIPDEDRHLPLIARLGEDMLNQSGVYGSVITGYIEGISGNGLTDYGQGALRLYRFNASLSALYNEAFREERGNLPINQLIFEISDSSDFRTRYIKRPDYDNMYCYDLIMPVTERARLRYIMREDLRRYFNVKVMREKRRMNVFEVTKGPQFDNLLSEAEEGHVKTNNGKVTSLQGMPFDYLVQTLNSRAVVPIISKSADIGPVDLKIPDDLEKYTPAQLKAWLYEQGLSVRENQLDMDVAVFRPSFISLNHN